MKRKTFIFWVGIFAASLILAGNWLRRREESTTSDPQALGLRGTSKVSRPLSKTQTQRLEKYFLDVPAPARSQGGPQAPVARTLSQVETINQMNARQER